MTSNYQFSASDLKWLQLIDAILIGVGAYSVPAGAPTWLSGVLILAGIVGLVLKRILADQIPSTPPTAKA